jgi:hypothetical protein
MNLVIAVTLGNCTIAIILLVITIQTMRLRRQIVGLTSFFDRWLGECHVMLIEAPRSISATRTQISQFRRIYSQQVLMVDRVQTLRSVAGMGRSLLLKRGIRRV